MIIKIIKWFGIKNELRGFLILSSFSYIPFYKIIYSEDFFNVLYRLLIFFQVACLIK